MAGSSKWIILSTVTALLFCGVFFVPTVFSQNYQPTPIVLQASRVLPEDLLAGTNYRVRGTVVGEGLINKYDLDTVYGAFRVETTALLFKRIGELKALSRITQLQGSDVYINAATMAVTGPIDTVMRLVSNPDETVSEVANGIGRFFSNAGDAITSDNPYQGSAASSILGQTSYKRQYAYLFGVDPYSPYEPLQEALDDLAWTAAVGGLTVKAAFLAVPGGAGVAVGLSGAADSLRAMIRDKTPDELAKMNQNTLAGMGISPSLVQAFIQNPSFDPQEQTLLVGALAGMQGVRNPGIFIQSAATANAECSAVFFSHQGPAYGAISKEDQGSAKFYSCRGYVLP
jgi:hypothetical protein